MGYQIGRVQQDLPIDISADKRFLNLYERCREFSMTSVERMYSLFQAVNYILDHDIAGDFVECGVWKGGSSMMMALALQERNVQDRKIYLYDTFEGMSEPTELDKTQGGDKASALLQIQRIDDEKSIWCYSSLDDVKKNLFSTGYPQNKIEFIKGKVEDTLSGQMPGPLALLRLDTDWYESTKLELELLYPLLNKSGILIIDDFGHWEGAKKAVVEYFAKSNEAPFLNRIDFTGRLMIK